MKTHTFTTTLLISLFILTISAHAQQNWGWSPSIRDQNFIASGMGNHRIHYTIPDGNMGVWVVFGLDLGVEDGDQEQLFVQHVDSIGKCKWPSGNARPIGFANEAMYYPDAIPDDSGGIIFGGIRHKPVENNVWKAGAMVWQMSNIMDDLVWQAQPWEDGLNYLFPLQLASDMRQGAWAIAYNDTMMFLKHVRKGGIVADTGMGLIISESVYVPVQGDQPEIISDGAGGVYIAWMDFRKDKDAEVLETRYNDIWMQHIDSTGSPQWGTQGIPIDTTDGWHSDILLHVDVQGGVYIVYYNNIDSSIRVQRRAPDGSSVWNPPSIVATRLMKNYDGHLSWDDVKFWLTPSFDNNIILTLAEKYKQGTVPMHHSWFQRIAPDGRLRWNNGKGVVLNCNLELHSVAPDDSGGIFIVRSYHKLDSIVVPPFSELLIQRRTCDGVAKVSTYGNLIFQNRPQREFYFSDYFLHKRPNFVSDGRHGAIGVYAEREKLGFNLFKHKLFAFRVNSFSDKYPVELSTFTAIRDGQSVLLEWHTESETNNMGFTVQRSEDEQQWEEIGYVPGHGTTTMPMDYEFTDWVEGNLPWSGTYYYRLKQTDFDGTYTYSGTAAVEFPEAITPGTLSVYPNPAQGYTSLAFTTGVAGNATIELFNSLGTKVHSSQVAITAAGAQRIPLDTFGLLPGVYHCRVTSADQVLQARVVVARH